MDILVEPAWLAEHLNDTNLVILDATMPPVGVTPPVDTRGRYEASHLPGAIFFDIDEISDHSTPLPHMLPSAEEFAARMSSLGIRDTDTIVIYEQVGVFSAPRAWWTLNVMGATDVRILNGGLAAWQAANHPLESDQVTRNPATFNATLNAKAVVSYAQLQDILAEPTPQVLDARSAGRFSGTAPEPRAGLRSGHMPGATSLPFTELVEDGKLKSPEALQNLFAQKGIDLTSTITTSCGSGVTAAVLALGLQLAGADKVQLYDGSWAEYASRPESVIEPPIEAAP